MRSGPVSSEDRVFLTAAAVEPTHEGARRLGEAYWREVAAFSRGLVRPRARGDGIDLVVGRGALLRFGRAETTVEGGVVECRFPIEGGLLAAEPGGSLVIAQERRGTRHELRLAVEGFHPRLARAGRLARLRAGLYDALQSPLHGGVSRRFLERAARGPL